MGLQLEDLRVNVFLDIGPDTKTIVVRSDCNSPQDYEAAQERWKRLREAGGEINLSMIEPFRSRAAKISDLRSAYLLVFAAMGYSWGFIPALEVVRDQIRHPEEELIEPDYFWHWRGWREDPSLRWILWGAGKVDLLHVRLGRHSLILPGLDATAGFYDRLADHVSPGDEVKVRGKAIPWPLTLVAEGDYEIGAQSS